jgi:hypothetical protein
MLTILALYHSYSDRYCTHAVLYSHCTVLTLCCTHTVLYSHCTVLTLYCTHTVPYDPRLYHSCSDGDSAFLLKHFARAKALADWLIARRETALRDFGAEDPRY